MLLKFSSAEGTNKILEGLSIFASSPLHLNYPFESRPSWTLAHQDQWREQQDIRDQMMAVAAIFGAMKGERIQQIANIPALDRRLHMDINNTYGLADQFKGAAIIFDGSKFVVIYDRRSNGC